jgi:hypothetical protein
LNSSRLRICSTEDGRSPVSFLWVDGHRGLVIPEVNAEYTTLPLSPRFTLDAITRPLGWIQSRVGFDPGPAWRVISYATAEVCGTLCLFWRAAKSRQRTEPCWPCPSQADLPSSKANCLPVLTDSLPFHRRCGFLESLESRCVTREF